MTTATVTATLPRVAQLVLLRLLVAGTRPLPASKLRQDVGRLCPQPVDDNDWNNLMHPLAESGWLTPRPLRLTDAGRAEALALLGLTALPARLNWQTLQNRYLVPRALGLADAPRPILERIGKADGLAAWLLKRHFTLSLSGVPPLGKALEALACQRLCGLLGMPTETTFVGLQSAILSQVLGLEEKLTTEQLKQQLPRHIVQGRRTGLDGLRKAILLQWAGASTPSELESAPSEPVTRPETNEDRAFDLAGFAAMVLVAAESCPTGRFGDNKVFINHVWRHWRDGPGTPPLELPTFKGRLVEANRAGLLHLSRADLVQVMDPTDVAESETAYLNSLFHFVLLEGNRS